MEGFGETLRRWVGKQTEGVRGCLTFRKTRLRQRIGKITPRRAAAVVVALSLWMGVGRMDSSGEAMEIKGEVFGEVHWYSPGTCLGPYSDEEGGG
jgi:hypothetical protein